MNKRPKKIVLSYAFPLHKALDYIWYRPIDSEMDWFKQCKRLE